MAIATNEDTRAKPLPAPNSDFYQHVDVLSHDELAVVRKVRAYMETSVQPIINKYWSDDAFPFELLPLFKELGRGGLGYEGYGCAGGSQKCPHPFANGILKDADSDVKPATVPIKDRLVFGTEDYPLVSNFWHRCLLVNEGILMPAKRRLTMRQLRQMLRLAGSGTSSREIAAALGIARWRRGEIDLKTDGANVPAILAFVLALGRLADVSASLTPPLRCRRLAVGPDLAIAASRRAL